jgi:ABC-type uncharacterized transport system involved in gliding motility auxiliary subunit/ABC-type transport system involved in multi-copper enzyme maturation permease subunit
MKNIITITKKELATYFNSPIAYTVLGTYLLVGGWLFFYFSGLFMVGKASMRGFFAVSPLLFMFVAPAVTMRLIAEERKTGTLEGLMTLPVREFEVVLGKFFAALAMLCVGLLFTVPYAFSLVAITAPGQTFDWGPIIGGYVGMMFMGGAYLSAGLWISSISKNQITAFIFALALTFALWVLDKAILVLPAGLGEVIQYLGVNYHFENIARGVIDTRDVLYFVTVAAVFLFGAINNLESTRVGGLTPRSVLAGLPVVGLLFASSRGGGRAAHLTRALIVGSLVLLNIAMLRMFARVDLTHDKIFTLSEATEETLEQVENPVKITAYFSQDLPPPFSDTSRYLKDLLEEYRAASNGRVSFEFIDPMSQETAEDKEIKKDIKRDIFGRAVREKTSVEAELAALGIQPVEVRVFEEDQAQTKRAYMGIAVRHGEKQEAIPLIQDTATLEYDITTVVRRLVREKQAVVGVVQGHGEPDLNEHMEKLTALLKPNYEMRAITIGTGDAAKIADDVDALLIVGPQSAYAPEELNAIDAFMMKGKGAAFLLGRQHVDYSNFAPRDLEMNLEGLVSAYGVELGSQLVGDVECASLSVSEKRGFMVVQMPVKYPFLPQIKALEGDSPMTKGLGDVTLPFPLPLYPKTIEGLEIKVLAKSTPKSWLEDGTVDALSPRRDWSQAQVGFTGPYNLIAQVRGSIPSFVDPKKKSEKEARMVVIGSSGLVNEQVLTPSNAALTLNIVDWLLLDANFLKMRSRGQGEPPLDPELSDNVRNVVKAGNLIGAPLLLVVYGLVRWRMRESRRKKLIASAP